MARSMPNFLIRGYVRCAAFSAGLFYFGHIHRVIMGDDQMGQTIEIYGAAIIPVAPAKEDPVRALFSIGIAYYRYLRKIPLTARVHLSERRRRVKRISP